MTSARSGASAPSSPSSSSPPPPPSHPNGAWCPEFRPTRDEFQSFAKYMRTVVEPQCAHIGVCKIVPPEGWFSRSYALADLEQVCTVTKPVSQHVAGKKGIFNVDLVERKTMQVQEFKALADTLGRDKDEPTDLSDVDDVERQFWKSLRPTMDAPVYGADIVSSLFGDDPVLSWNLNKLDTILKRIDLPGVTRAMLYFGMWRAMFAFHTEDMDLYSINYLHTGKPKFWYAVPPQSASQLERAAQSMFPEKHHACNQFMRHKTSLISPSRLKEFGVPFYKAYQQPGEFVITFPATYHEGFNLGFNIAEAVNFASLRWVPFGLKAKVCKCSPDSVRIDMDVFLTKLFDPSDGSKNQDTLSEDAWVFSCACNKYYSSEDQKYTVEDQWFECSVCKIWAHLGCIHPDLVHLQGDELPQAILCHRCSPDESTARSQVARKTTKRGRSHTPKKSGSPRKPSKRRVKSLADSESDSNMCASPISGSLAETPTTTPTKRRNSVTTPKKSLLVKGSTIYLKDAEAKVAAVEGNFIRVHYKGQSVDNDEWLPINSKDLRGRIVAVSPPPKLSRPKAA
ncbi:hypothetical protein Gpo141_00001051 [Globisporangium polare]